MPAAAPLEVARAAKPSPVRMRAEPPSQALVITNVPGPQFPLYAAGAKMLEMFPVIPLAAGQAVSIGLTSYDGGVYFGLNADRGHMHDVDVLASLIEESLAELVLAADGGRGR